MSDGSHISLETSYSKTLIYNTSALSWNAATGSVAGEGNVTVVNFPATYDVSDRAGRLVGAISGSVGMASNVPDTIVSGDITTATPGAGNTVSITLGGHKSCSVTISGAWTGTLVVESNIDAGATWVVCWLSSIAATTDYALPRPVNILSANGAYTIYNTTGVTAYRVRATAFTPGGTATCKLTATESPPAAIFATAAITDIIGRMGRMRLSPMGALKTAPTTRLAGQTISGSVVDASYWATTVVGTGAVTQNYGVMTLTTAATADSSCLVTSQRVARYTGGNPNYFRANVNLPAVTTGTAGFVNTRRWGAFDAANGYFFAATQTNPASAPTLSVVCRKTDGGGLVDTPVTTFNGDYGASYALDVNVHTYEIWWTNKSVWFWIDDVLLHTITSTTVPLTATPHQKVGFQTINSGGNTGVNTLNVRSGTINRLGNLLHQPLTYYRATTVAAQVLKYGPGNVHSMAIGVPVDGAAVTLYDALAATGGTELFSTGVMDVKANNNVMPIYIDFKGIPFATGLTMAIANKNCPVQVGYE